MFPSHFPNRDQTVIKIHPGIGLLLPGVRARVVKADGSLAGYNEPGELVVKTPSLFLGYWKNEEASKEAFTADGSGGALRRPFTCL
jgi:long-subunit acyl-CoA synthetase (AMP-forming)